MTVSAENLKELTKEKRKKEGISYYIRNAGYIVIIQIQSFFCVLTMNK